MAEIDETRLDALQFLFAEETNADQQLSANYLMVPVLDSAEREEVVIRLMDLKEAIGIEDDCLFLAVNVMDHYLATTAKNPFNVENHLFPAINLIVGFLYCGAILAQGCGEQIKDCPPKMSFCNLVEPTMTEAEMGFICKEINRVGNCKRSITSVAAMRCMVEHDQHALFLLKLALTQHEFLRFPPSLIAAVAVHISWLLNPCKLPRVKIHVTISGYSPRQLQECFNSMFDLLQDLDQAKLIKKMHHSLVKDLQLDTTP